MPESVSQNVRVLADDGSVLYESRPFGRQTESAGAVNPWIARALIATEDRRFFFHPGVDPVAIARAAWSNSQAGSVVSGASTIAMQVARMRRGGGRTTWRTKIQDAVFALRLTFWRGQAAILHEWLSRAYFGRRAYGIEAASEAYFGKSSADLSIGEAAYLIGLPQRPSQFGDALGRTIARRNTVLGRLRTEGSLSSEQARQLEVLPLDLAEPPDSPDLAPHLSLHLIAGASGSEFIQTTLDHDLQQRVEGLARAHVNRLSARGLGQVAAIVIENESREVKAYLGSADYFDEPGQGANDGVQMRRQPGSALKPFVYAEAFNRGAIGPASLLADIETPFVDEGAAFSPQNYDRRYHGPVSARRALANSFNVPAVRLARTLGPDRVLDRLHTFGFESLQASPEFYGVGIALGNGEVSLWELGNAYASLARRGQYCDLRLFPDSEMNCRRALPAAPAFLITSILSDPGARSEAFGRGGPLEFDFPVAAKTGTSKDYRDNWAIGYTPRHTVAVWAGNFDGSPMKSLAGVQGAGVLMHSIMESLGSGGSFSPPEGVQSRRICAASGQLPGAWCRSTRMEFFLSDHLPMDTCTVHRRFAVDLDTGLLASHVTPDDRVQYEDFEVYPEEFRPWMVANGVRLPPPPPATADLDQPAILDAALLVQYPPDGTIFQLDPVLRPEYQTIRLRAALPGDRFGAHWTVDGERLPGSQVDSVLWPLRAGRHRLQLAAYDAQGRPVVGRPVSIRVLPVSPLDDAP